MAQEGGLTCIGRQTITSSAETTIQVFEDQISVRPLDDKLELQHLSKLIDLTLVCTVNPRFSQVNFPPSPSGSTDYVLPPTRSLASTTTQQKPTFCTSHAAFNPLRPAPTTMTSNFRSGSCRTAAYTSISNLICGDASAGTVTRVVAGRCRCKKAQDSWHVLYFWDHNRPRSRPACTRPGQWYRQPPGHRLGFPLPKLSGHSGLRERPCFHRMEQLRIVPRFPAVRYVIRMVQSTFEIAALRFLISFRVGVRQGHVLRPD